MYEGRVEEMDDIKARYIKKTGTPAPWVKSSKAPTSSRPVGRCIEAEMVAGWRTNPASWPWPIRTPEITPELAGQVGAQRRDHLYRPLGLSEPGQ